MNKLIASLTASGSQIRTNRATTLGNQILGAQQALALRLSNRGKQIQHELSQLMDLAPTSTTSLQVGHEQFKPDAFVNRIQDLKVELDEVNRQFAIAKLQLREWAAAASAAEANDNAFDLQADLGDLGIEERPAQFTAPAGE